MKYVKCFFAAVAVTSIAFAASAASAGQLLSNTGFEDPIADGGDVDGNWNSFSGGNAFSINSTVMPLSGLQNLDSTITAANTFTGVFQYVRNIAPETNYDFGIWAKRVGPLDVDVEHRIEWINAAGDEVSRDQILLTGLTEDYQLFTVSGLAPADAVALKAVDALASFNVDPVFGTVFYDDAFVNGIPEPASAVLMG